MVNALDDLPLWRAARRNDARTMREQCVNDAHSSAAARRTDPPTSQAAGRNSRRFAGGHCRLILEALALGPGTKDELAARCGLDEQQVARRMHELRRAGLVVELGEAVSPSGNRETRYGGAWA